MDNVTPQAAMALAGADVLLILYSRGVIQQAWNALWGNASPFTHITAGATVDTPNGTGASGGPIIGLGPGASDALTQAEQAVTQAGAPDGTQDWLNWCLNWVDNTWAKLGKPQTRYGTAQQACDAAQLQPGQAPRGAGVCFQGNHIGISNGDGTYTSVGIQHGGPITLPYLNNPAYSGWFMPN